VHEAKCLRATVTEEVHVIDEKGQVKVLALKRALLGIRWKEAEQRKFSCRSRADIEPLQISYLLIELLLPLYRTWSSSVLPVEVTCAGAISASTMSFLSNKRLSKKTQTLTIMLLQKKLEVAFK